MIRRRAAPVLSHSAPAQSDGLRRVIFGRPSFAHVRPIAVISERRSRSQPRGRRHSAINGLVGRPRSPTGPGIRPFPRRLFRRSGLRMAALQRYAYLKPAGGGFSRKGNGCGRARDLPGRPDLGRQLAVTPEPGPAFDFVGAPGEVRTPNPRFRRPMLYPIELRALNRARISTLRHPLLERRAIRFAAPYDGRYE
jgi:hypothetical protein